MCPCLPLRCHSLNHLEAVTCLWHVVETAPEQAAAPKPFAATRPVEPTHDHFCTGKINAPLSSSSSGADFPYMIRKALLCCTTDQPLLPCRYPSICSTRYLPTLSPSFFMTWTSRYPQYRCLLKSNRPRASAQSHRICTKHLAFVSSLSATSRQAALAFRKRNLRPLQRRAHRPNRPLA